MEPKAQHYAIHKWIIPFLVFLILSNGVVGQTVSSLEIAESGLDNQKVDRIHREIDSLFWVSTGGYLNVNPPQHFLFSIKFELGATEEIVNIMPSKNMDAVFEKSIDSLRALTRRNLFVGSGIGEKSVIIPVFIFVTSKPDYRKSLFRIKEIWSYDNINELPVNAVILPPIHGASSKAHVTLKIDESELDNTPNKLHKSLPRSNN
ncbi:hypothetical protein [Parapedobacter sp. 10938]|uniref:hypothetical protein n=1 Tax=Parapedobacter flavus TaxID=3110225 RepID=UPI002DBE73E9|nr:hypothetical protein [Parapedobacter sp. 10938]MEC3878766.1 hypothetical protein [Parapedobacter sp. 10938]